MTENMLKFLSNNDEPSIEFNYFLLKLKFQSSKTFSFQFFIDTLNDEKRFTMFYLVGKKVL